MRRLLPMVMAAMALLLSGCVTASVLPDGRVLLVSATGAKLFDPVTGTTTVTGSPAVPRVGYAATTLRDGRVLVTGGIVDDKPLSSAEIWDPATGLFTSAGDMTVPRGLHTATTLTDGRVLLAGGGEISSSGSQQPSLASTELFDPTTGTFAATGDMTVPRALHSATLLKDGRVLILGGGSGGSATGAIATAEIYDPTTGTFSASGTQDPAISQGTATLLPDGRILVAGGFQGSDASAKDAILAAAAILDPTTGVFTPTGAMTVPRAFQTATLLKDGRVLIAGGASSANDPGWLTSAEVFDPDTGMFTPTGAMTTGRGGHVAARLPDGRVMVVSGDVPLGEDTPTDLLATAEAWDPGTGAWTTLELPGQPKATQPPKPTKKPK